MHLDARKLDNGTLITGDICIVGAGAAGISMALEWINTAYKVILLEGGGFEYDERVQELYDGKTTGQRYYPLKSSRLHYFGGTTGHWAGYCSPLDEIDFVKRDWIDHSGWPIQRKDLDPYYERAQKNLDLGPYPYQLTYWQKQDPFLVSLLPNETVVWNKMWQFSPPTRFGEKYKDTIVQARNIHLYTYSNVVDLQVNENVSLVKELTVKNYAGKEHRVRAKHFVMACCSIQNARLLLASNRQAARGLGNDYDLVGRYFMEHLEIKSAELWLGVPLNMKLYSMIFGVTKARAELAITAKKQEAFKILNGTVSLSPLGDARKRRPIIDVWSDKDPRKNEIRLYENFKDLPSSKPSLSATTENNAFELFTRIEQAPNPSCRVTLDSERDALGVPRATLHWELTPFEKRSIRTIYELIGQQTGLAGIGRVRLMDYLQDEKDHSWPSFTGGGWHHMGTTRMSADPRQGVVDANCKVHGIANLYMAGSSCFVTAGAPNPTLSLVALSLRLSDHLMDKMKNRS